MLLDRFYILNRQFGVEFGRRKGLFVESGIIVKTIERAEHLEVFLRNKHHAPLAHQLAQRGIFVGTQGVSVRLVQRVEARDAELRQALVADKRHVEAARHEGGEVEPRHFVEQAVVGNRVGRIGKDKDKRRVALGREGSLLRGISADRVAQRRAAAPQRSEVVTARSQGAPAFKTAHNHTRHVAHVALRVVAHEVFQLRDQLLRVGRGQTAERMHEDKLRAVQPHRELRRAKAIVVPNGRRVALRVRRVGGGIERVFYFLSVTRGALVVGRSDGARGLSLGIFRRHAPPRGIGHITPSRPRV